MLFYSIVPATQFEITLFFELFKFVQSVCKMQSLFIYSNGKADISCIYLAVDRLFGVMPKKQRLLLFHRTKIIYCLVLSVDRNHKFQL